eukprot:CAMPEP_0114251908 /NCGR_PEP_ID=MMETSP0058-20121206/15535_1 /TAXON_ID=36894 /ORGANISM="Pyramimonas parkeae, CCMP726" /LENGTH=160 /DNA_ID=CAMNT_0001365769 /DNA_START=192 /DNA_END=674 /DNA_ORIENTATION=-
MEASTPRRLLALNPAPYPPWPSPPPAIPGPPGPPFYATPPQAPKGNALFGNWEDNLPPGSPLPPGQQHQDFGYWKSSVDDPISVSTSTSNAKHTRVDWGHAARAIPMLTIAVILAIILKRRHDRAAKSQQAGESTTGSEKAYGTFATEDRSDLDERASLL